MVTLDRLEKSEGREIEPEVTGPAVPTPVFVLFTSMDSIPGALQKAHQLATSIQTGIEILTVQMVPRLLPLDEPPVRFEFITWRIAEIAAQLPEEIKISNYLCRDFMQALERVLQRNCLVVMGVRKSWWPTRNERLARKLRHAGHDVILVESE